MKPYLVPTKLMTPAEKSTGTRMEVLEITKAVLAGWKSPDFQRPLKTTTPRFSEVTRQIRLEEVIPGVITIAVVGKDTYVLDGQHRLEAFKQAEIETAYADVRIHHFDTLAQAGDEWVRLNSQIIRVTPDDVLRAHEKSSEALSLIRKRCPFVGYDSIRRGKDSPLVSMSMVLRAWKGSEPEVPSNGGASAHEIARGLTVDEAEELSTVLKLFFDAWGRDSEYWRLWGSLNVVLCMWLYRRMVVAPYSHRVKRLTKDEFKKGIAALSASPDYMDWLVGRAVRDSDRSPAYQRIRIILNKRLAVDGAKIIFPAPAWYTGHVGTATR